MKRETWVRGGEGDGDGSGDADFGQGHVAAEGVDFHAGASGLRQRGRKSGVGLDVRRKDLRIGPLDDEDDGRPLPLRRLDGQLAQVSLPPQGRRVRKEGHPTLHQRDRFGLHPQRALRAVQTEIQAALATAHFPLQPRESGEGGYPPRLHRLSEERSRQTGIHGDQHPGVLHQQEVQRGAAMGFGMGDQAAGPPRGQQFRQAARIGQVGRDGMPIHLYPNAEAVFPHQETALDGRREFHIQK